MNSTYEKTRKKSNKKTGGASETAWRCGLPILHDAGAQRVFDLKKHLSHDGVNNSSRGVAAQRRRVRSSLLLSPPSRPVPDLPFPDRHLRMS